MLLFIHTDTCEVLKQLHRTDTFEEKRQRREALMGLISAADKYDVQVRQLAKLFWQICKHLGFDTWHEPVTQPQRRRSFLRSSDLSSLWVSCVSRELSTAISPCNCASRGYSQLKECINPERDNNPGSFAVVGVCKGLKDECEHQLAALVDEDSVLDVLLFAESRNFTRLLDAGDDSTWGFVKRPSSINALSVAWKEGAAGAASRLTYFVSHYAN